MSVTESLPKLPGIPFYRRNSVAGSVRSDNTTDSASTNGSVRSHKDYLAEKLRHNWNNKKSSLMELDDSLTNLGWLHGSQVTARNPLMDSEEGAAGRHFSASPEAGEAHHDTSNAACSESLNCNTNNNSAPQDWPFPVDHLTCGHGLFPVPSREEYRTNASLKPPFSYATMICMAMKELQKPKIALSDIYTWMSNNFLYYRVCNSSWQNSVRHNLSLNKCFEKVPRRKDEPGKGGFWRVNQKYAHILESGITKRRRPLPYIDSNCSAYINYSFEQQQQQLAARGGSDASPHFPQIRGQQEVQEESPWYSSLENPLEHTFKEEPESVALPSVQWLHNSESASGSSYSRPVLKVRVSHDSNFSSLGASSGAMSSAGMAGGMRAYLKRPREEHPPLQASSNLTFRTVSDNGRVETQVLRAPIKLEQCSVDLGLTLNSSVSPQQSPAEGHSLPTLTSCYNSPMAKSSTSNHLFPPSPKGAYYSSDESLMAQPEYLWDRCNSYFSEETTCSPPDSSSLSLSTPNHTSGLAGGAGSMEMMSSEQDLFTGYSGASTSGGFLGCSLTASGFPSLFQDMDTLIPEYYQEDEPHQNSQNVTFRPLSMPPTSMPSPLSPQHHQISATEPQQPDSSTPMEELHDFEHYFVGL